MDLWSKRQAIAPGSGTKNDVRVTLRRVVEGHCMRRILIAASAFLIASAALAADDSAWTDIGLRGQFVRAGGAFACEVKPDRAITDTDRKHMTQQACLHIGALAIGGAEATLAQVLGKEEDKRPAERGAFNYVYFRNAAGDAAFILVTVQSGLIVAIQITGPEPMTDFSFNGIDLGAGTDAVVKLFGRPTKVGLAGQPGVERWTYRPWTFSFEVTDGEVTTIRIANEDFR
jgi:hypothetical protein